MGKSIHATPFKKCIAHFNYKHCTNFKNIDSKLKQLCLYFKTSSYSHISM